MSQAKLVCSPWLALSVLAAAIAGCQCRNLVGLPPYNENVTSTPDHAIPHTLHHIYLNGAQDFEEKAAAGAINKTYMQSCQTNHHQWFQMFWEQEAADNLVAADFPWFLETWRSYTRKSTQEETLRYMLMYAYGGLFVDMDVECFASADATLASYGVVLQGSGPQGVTNAVLAGAPGNPFWLEVLKVCEERSPLNNPDIPTDPSYQTGPNALGTAVQRYYGVDVFTHLGGGFSGYTVDDWDEEAEVTVPQLKVYGTGDWFAPCWLADLSCWRHFKRGLLQGSWNMERLVGAHWFEPVEFAGSWNVQSS